MFSTTPKLIDDIANRKTAKITLKLSISVSDFGLRKQCIFQYFLLRKGHKSLTMYGRREWEFYYTFLNHTLKKGKGVV